MNVTIEIIGRDAEDETAADENMTGQTKRMAVMRQRESRGRLPGTTDSEPRVWRVYDRRGWSGRRHSRADSKVLELVGLDHLEEV